VSRGVALEGSLPREVMSASEPPAYADLYWIPLGAGAHVVRLSGRAYETLHAALQRRAARPLFHSALIVQLPEGRFTIEQTPVVDGEGRERGVTVEGPVGTSLAGLLRIFRYEIRCWRDGVIPDLAEAVGDPVRVTEDPGTAGRIVELVPSVPPLVWGRDQRRTGEMWNSNSVIAWLLEGAGIDATAIRPPHQGRAPGWRAGVTVARRARADA
jgi:hypothetical protein